MFDLAEIAFLAVFLFFYIGLLYNLPVLASGVRDMRRSRRIRAQGQPAYAGHLPFFSLLIPVKNEKNVVGRLLEDLSRLSYPTDKFEVVVVDDGSIDGTTEICWELADRFRNIRFLRREISSGKANALNYGLKHCSGEIVGIFDADNVVAKDALVKVSRYFDDSGVSAVQGRIHSINSGENMLTQFTAHEDAVWSEAYLRGKEVLGLFVHLRGCCEFIRRDVLEGLGGFDEGTLAEDIEISARLTNKGHRIRYAPDVWAWQESPAHLKQYLRQRVRWFRGHLEVAFRYGRLMSSVNRRTLDAEFTLFLPLVAIASMFSYWLASWAVFSSTTFNLVLEAVSIISVVGMSGLIVLCGLALMYVTKPTRVRSLLWLPFVFGYWLLESFLASYAVLLIVLRRPRSWAKTEKSGSIMSVEYESEKAFDAVALQNE